MIRQWPAIVFAALVFVSGVPLAAKGEIVSEQLRADFIIENALTKPGETVTIALRQDIAPGWHTYWKNPGDAGLAPDLAWKLPTGVGDPETTWPIPKRKEYGPLVNYGYSGQTAILYSFQVPADWPLDTALIIEADAEIMVCKDICIPVFGQLSATVKTGAENSRDMQNAALFKQVRSQLPEPMPWNVRAVSQNGDIAIHLQGPQAEFTQVSKAYVFVDEWGGLDHAAPQAITLDKTGLTITAKRGEAKINGPLSGVVTLYGTDGTSRSYHLSDIPMIKPES